MYLKKSYLSIGVMSRKSLELIKNQSFCGIGLVINEVFGVIVVFMVVYEALLLAFNNLNPNFSTSWPIKFHKKNPLPCA